MNKYKILKEQSKSPLATERAGPDNINIGDIIKYKTKVDFKYALVIDIRNIALKVRDLFFKDDLNFFLDDNHSENNSPHKGFLNYDYTKSNRVRKIYIVDRNQFLNNEDIKLDAITLKLNKIEKIILELKKEINCIKTI